MNPKYTAVMDDELRNSVEFVRNDYANGVESKRVPNYRNYDSNINQVAYGNDENAAAYADKSLSSIYGKIVKIRKELEKSYNLFYSYNLIVSNEGENNNLHSNYSNMYKRNDALRINTNTKNNLTLNKINALTNSFFMNVETLKNTYSFVNANNMNSQTIKNHENVIWERRVETLTNEANSYIKTLDGIYKSNLNNSERNKQNEMKTNNSYKDSRKNKKIYGADSTIGYLHNEKEILKEVENNLNVFHVQGMSTLELIRKQNKFLKNIRKKVIDIYNYVGLSSSLTDAIKKTHKQNLIIVIVGMILCLFFFYLLFIHFSGLFFSHHFEFFFFFFYCLINRHL
ncbi:hypothetical protein, conserved [Plasmodium gonderi]|uniref:SNARE protein n=1 Tax=Plasmodium gonderi TaxID=77519 RepID=A0A1Y1JLF9_PLAGO|nr:hypothetical protein, conserved [Plasmodium gonderi]GAW80884.1 hypothetical protein, conserved [Plasmodium gonderi]